MSIPWFLMAGQEHNISFTASVLELAVAAHPPPVLPEDALRNGLEYLRVRGQHFLFLVFGPGDGGELHLW